MFLRERKTFYKTNLFFLRMVMKTKLKPGIRKAFSWLFLVAVGIVLLFVIAIIFALTSVGGSQEMMTPYKLQRFGTVSSMPNIKNGYTDNSSGSSGSEVMPLAVSDIGTTPSSGVVVERKLTQNGYLGLQVKRVEDAINALTSMSNDMGGRVDSVQYSNNDQSDSKNATIILRVPTSNFSQAMDQAKSVALVVNSVNIATNDVTDQFVDLQAKLKNLKLEEVQYQDLMKKALKVSDILSVSHELESVRQQIDSL